MGSTGLRGAQVAEGFADVYVDTGARTKLWDTCTIDALVITAAGGRVSDVTGAPTDYRGSSLANDRGLLLSLLTLLTLMVSPRTVPIARARLMEMRIIPGMRAGRAADDARPSAVESAEVALRGRGFRLTAPRHAVLEVVWGIKTHPTAEEVHRLVIRRAPGVSLGTVYRNLRLLVDAGLLDERPGPRARFDANTRAHHHFTCLSCRRIVDIEAPVAEPHSRALSKRVEVRTGLTITHHRIDFFGRCLECQTKGRARPGRRRPAADVSARAANPSARSAGRRHGDGSG